MCEVKHLNLRATPRLPNSSMQYRQTELWEKNYTIKDALTQILRGFIEGRGYNGEWKEEEEEEKEEEEEGSVMGMQEIN